ncbi:MAG: AAA family ATPase [Thermodesulfovibrionia bacterium]|nr:AAA family ATPase [Thermodesulfovibrionia bacterium]
MLTKVTSEKLYRSCDPSELSFKTTEDIPPLEETIGQERALRSLDFGVGIDDIGFNIYILGESGTGKMTTIKNILEKKSKDRPVPNDWCYVYNFDNPDEPGALSLPPGMGLSLQKDMDELVKALQQELPTIFESKEYEKQRTAILEDFQKQQKDIFLDIEKEAKEKDFSLRKAVSGLALVPVKKSGETLSEEEYEGLDSKVRKKIEEIGKILQEKLDDTVRTVREKEKKIKEKLKQLERQAALSAVGHWIDELKNKYKEKQEVINYFEKVKEDILEHLEDFKPQEEQAPSLPFLKPQKTELSFVRYSVNLFVNNRDTKGAPVIIESNPTYYNLFGRIEHKLQYGVALTDFSMIKAGSLQRANGGYLVTDSLEILKNIFVYDALKRAIKDQKIRIEDVWEQYRLISSVSLRPEAVPFNVKIVLVGDPRLYYLLFHLDPEYRDLFKVKADFDYRMLRSKENVTKYASFVRTKCKEKGLSPFDYGAVSKVIEYSSRLAEHQEKLSARFSEVADLIKEAHYWSKLENSDIVKTEHVEKALDEKIYRVNKVEKKIQEAIKEGTILVDMEGAVVGQINGLSVLDLGDYSFSIPSRITAKTYAGKAGIVNIERETKLSGKIHEKAVFILGAYLGGKYAQKRPFSLSASLTFEQLYGGVEGDSATCAEVYALLSSISGVPIKQSIAITGSMNQHGDVQPIGGVNEKIEGFFEVCKLNNLNGEQGVIIPKTNLINLILKKEVVEAVKDEKFNIYTIDNIEDGIEILTGMPPGELQPDGNYPEGTLNFLVSKKLQQFSEALKEKGKGKKGDNNNK